MRWQKLDRMAEYRIVEETGKLTGNKNFYIQVRRKKLFGGYKWVNKYQYRPECSKMLVEFDTLKEAKEWVDYWTETLDIKYHKCGG